MLMYMQKLKQEAVLSSRKKQKLIVEIINQQQQTAASPSHLLHSNLRHKKIRDEIQQNPTPLKSMKQTGL